MGKSLGEDLMAEVLRSAIPVQHRHLPDPATKFASFCSGQLLNHWPTEAPDFPDPHSEGSTQILIMDTVEGPNRAC